MRMGIEPVLAVTPMASMVSMSVAMVRMEYWRYWQRRCMQDKLSFEQSAIKVDRARNATKNWGIDARKGFPVGALSYPKVSSTGLVLIDRATHTLYTRQTPAVSLKYPANLSLSSPGFQFPRRDDDAWMRRYVNELAAGTTRR